MCNRFTSLKRCLFIAVLAITIPFINACKKPEKKPMAQKKRTFTDYEMFSNVNGADTPDMDLSHRLKSDDKLNKITGYYYKRKKKFNEFDIIYVHQNVPEMNILTGKYVFGDAEKCNFRENDNSMNIRKGYCRKLYDFAERLAKNKFVSKELPYKSCYDCSCIYLHINFQGKIFESFDCVVRDYQQIVYECNACDLKKLCIQDNIKDTRHLNKLGCELYVEQLNSLCEEFKLGKTPDGKIRSTKYFDKTCKETNEIKELIDLLFMVGNGKK